MGMAYHNIAELFGDQAAMVAWIKVSSFSTLNVFVSIMAPGTESAYLASDSLEDKLYMPHVAKNTEIFSTFLSTVNGTADGIQTVLRPKPSGSIKVLPELADSFGKLHTDITALYSDLSNINWILEESNAAATASMEYFLYNNEDRMASLGLTDQKGKTLRFLHVATDTSNFWTGMVYLNVGDAPANITETYYGADGSVIKTYTPDPLAANDKVTLLFDANTQDRVPAGTAWVSVTSDQDLVGYELFGSINGGASQNFAGIQGNYTSGNVVDFPVYSAEAGRFYGFVVVNVGEVAADVTFDLMSASGSKLATFVQNVAPKNKVTSLGSAMFTDAIAQASGAWVRATASGSQFAGFVLWGDVGETRNYLSGINGRISTQSGGGEPTERVFMPMTPGNIGYGSAMIVSPVGGVFNVNIVGNLAQNTNGDIVNDYGSGQDDIEAVFSFTLTEPKALVVATAPSSSQADIDVFIVNSQRADGNFFDVNANFDPTIDFAATCGGYESMARVFQPGTYYILVSLFEGDPIPQTDFGLLVTEQPLYLNTFETTDDVNRQAMGGVWTFNADADGQANWGLLEWPEAKFGNALFQGAGASGAQEGSGLQTDFMYIPANGITSIDFDSGNILLNPLVTGEEPNLGLYLFEESAEGLEYINGFQWSSSAAGEDREIDGTTYEFLDFSRWVSVMCNLGSAFDSQPLPDTTMAFAILTGNYGQPWVIDNFRVYTVHTSLDAKKRAEEPGRVISGADKKAKFTDAKQIHLKTAK
jgi:hypothetical protein